MKRIQLNQFLVSGFRNGSRLCLLLICFFVTVTCLAQQTVVVNLASADGVDLTPENILNYQIHSSAKTNRSVIVKGVVRYRNSDLRFSYSYPYMLQPGVNMISSNLVHPQWEFSKTALKELFFNYKKLPQGTYEYCVEVTTSQSAGESPDNENGQDCLYRQSEDLFMISLIDPENNAKIHEYNPMLSWVVNYPFVGDLTYRIRVAEIKQGQNTQNAIVRNNPVYDERNLTQPSVIYPVYAKPLKLGQPYAWTVDAYYKGILLGGAEAWKFTIVEDSEYVAVQKEQSYYDFSKHRGESSLIAIGDLKLKYVSGVKTDSLSLDIFDKGETKKVRSLGQRQMNYADNLFSLDLRDRLKHKERYVLVMRNLTGKIYRVPFIYYNPLFVK